jgi:hypothetical protein
MFGIEPIIQQVRKYLQGYTFLVGPRNRSNRWTVITLLAQKLTVTTGTPLNFVTMVTDQRNIDDIGNQGNNANG